jgi:conjugal transfer pilus assembly protein TraW
MAYFIIALLFCTAILDANDLGTFGTTFPIAEEDFLIVLQERLAEANSDKDKQEKMQKTFVESVAHPKGIQLPRAKNQRTYEFDPTLYLREDIKDHEEHIIASKGTRINPLETVSLYEDLLFFDGNDAQQLSWAKCTKGKWILTQGNPIKMEDQELRPVYFDQSGHLSRKLGIKALPARVTQQGKKLRIEEIPCI